MLPLSRAALFRGALGLSLLAAAAPRARADGDGEFAQSLAPGGKIVADAQGLKGLDKLPVAAAKPAPPGECDPGKFYGPAPDPNAPLPNVDAASRIQGRDFPSVFEAWTPADRLDQLPFGGMSALQPGPENIARHDLSILGPWTMGLVPNAACQELATGFTPASIQKGLAARGKILAANKNAVVLMEIKYATAQQGSMPSDSPWWSRDAAGNRILVGDATGVTSPYYYLDFANPSFQEHVAQQCRAAVQSGVFDGCFFDRWDSDSAKNAALLRVVRDPKKGIGDSGLIFVNCVGNVPGPSLQYINGLYMEGFNPDSKGFWGGWDKAAQNLSAAQSGLRSPRFVALEGWYSTSRSDVQGLMLMRAVTTFVMTHSDGYVLFGDHDAPGRPDHQHDWYPFWDKCLDGRSDKCLGKPAGPGQQQPDGSFRREFDGGTVVFNPPTNGWVTPKFAEPRVSVATHNPKPPYQIQPGDGDILLK
jgi:hypothetical protein